MLTLLRLERTPLAHHFRITPGQRHSGEGRAHEYARSDAPSPGSTRAGGGCEPGIQCRRMGAEGSDAQIKGSDAVDGIRAGEEDEEWEMELVSAVAEARGSEEESEDAVHRLTATLAFLIRLSPFYDDQLAPLLIVLQVGEALKGKLTDDGKLKVRRRKSSISFEVQTGCAVHD
ncbi:hypothetical protein BC826DRAFT_664513 [Russula brevipes]|nr:hypothetical protein BC826DRAFT_664513 [Russula brevipes]